MAEVSPNTIGSIIGVSIGVLSFFASNAIKQIRDYETGYLKFGAGVALFLSYIILLTLLTIVLNVGAFADSDLLVTGLWFVFIAFYLPSLFLFIPLAREMWTMLFEGEQNRWYLAGIVFLLLFLTVGLLSLNPAS